MPVCNNCGRHIAIASTERECPICGASFLPAEDYEQSSNRYSISWEYKEERISRIYGCERELNEAGKNGWELLGIYREDGRVFAIFKRQKMY